VKTRNAFGLKVAACFTNQLPSKVPELATGKRGCRRLAACGRPALADDGPAVSRPGRHGALGARQALVFQPSARHLLAGQPYYTPCARQESELEVDGLDSRMRTAASPRGMVSGRRGNEDRLLQLSEQLLRCAMELAAGQQQR
jgi:hypothetical protein